MRKDRGEGLLSVDFRDEPKTEGKRQSGLYLH